MKSLLDLIKSAHDFAYDTIDAREGPELHAATAERFKRDGGASEDWAQWHEHVANFRAHFKLLRADKTPGQIAGAAKSAPAPAPKP